MIRKKIVTDIDACGRLWNSLIPVHNLSDLWEIRLCFHQHYRHRLHFLVFEDRNEIVGMIPLVYLTERDKYVFFPGEIWNGKTWLERTSVFCRRPEDLGYLLSECPDRTYLRYIDSDHASSLAELDVDETAYLLYPPEFNFDLDLYYQRFVWKKLKAIKKEIASFLGPESSWHLNRLPDYDLLVEMNLKRFGETSYFYDSRFAESFRDVMHLLDRKGWLRMVSLQIGAETAAIDFSALFNGSYVVMLGGTHLQFPGIAKAMNMQHIEFACQSHVSKVDFLCGDFCWKKLWHLDPEPLYKYVSPELKREQERVSEEIEKQLDMTDPVKEIGVLGL
jgi:hypothetical protein